MEGIEMKGMKKRADDDSIYSNVNDIEVAIVDTGGVDNRGYENEDNGARQRVPTKTKSLENGKMAKGDEEDLGYFSARVEAITSTVYTLFKNNNNVIKSVFYAIVLLLYFAYFGYAMYFRFGDEGSYRLLVCTIIGVVLIVYRLIAATLLKDVNMSCFENTGPTAEKAFRWIHIAAAISVMIAVLIYVIITVAINTPRNMVSLGGMAFFILTFYIFSARPSKVKVRPVFWGLAIQFIFALIILRWDGGFRAFRWLGDRVSEFLSYSDAGAKFVFGDVYEHHFFAFKVLPVIIFFSTAISVLYYIGVMQFIISNIARFMAKLLGTSAAESLNAAGNIFIGQTEAPLMIRPFLLDMTNSELHAIMTGGFATIAGSVMAAYINFGVPANHLLSASVMSAPAALAMSKLFYPETEEIKASEEDVYNMEKGDERNIIEAASKGAAMSIKLVANIAANLIAFISLLAFVNATLRWFGERVGLENPPLTFEVICSYVFWPLAFIMGVDRDNCLKVGELIGIKIFTNEFVAYSRLAKFITNAKNLTWYEGLTNSSNLTFRGVDYYDLTGSWETRDGDIYLRDLNVTLEGGTMTDRSVVIATYALCGFSNISSMGIMLGGLGAMAPSRKSDMTKIVFRAMIAGNVACFMTACIAGLLYEGEL
ncbi:hypothetical protein ScPMuIL_015747 [Solemya velum]